MRRSLPLPLLFACCLFWANAATAQQKPEEAIADFLTAQDESAILPHLPDALVAALDKISREEREEFLTPFALGKTLAAEGVELTRSPDQPFEFQIVGKREAKATLTLTATEMAAGKAAVHLLVASQGKQSPLTVYLRQEGGAWRLINVEAEGKNLLPDLDQPELALRTLTKDQMAANESSAVGSLRTINTGAVTYAAGYPELGVPPDLESLGPAPDGAFSYTPQHAGILDERLACPDASCVKSGYRIEYQRVDKEHYRATAVPVTYGVTGVRSFFTDESGVLRVTLEDRAPNETDAPLQ